MIQVLLVDDHQLFIEGLKAMFTAEDGIAITQSTHNGNEVPELIQNGSFDLVLLDISMPILDGPGVLELLNKRNITLPVLMLTMHSGFKELRRTLSLGAAGYVLKDSSREELVEAVKTVARGENYFHAKVQTQMLEYFRGKKSAEEERGQLSEREIEIIREIAAGGTSKEIAERLFLSEHTVRTHRRNILHKLGLNNTAELIHQAMEQGWI